MDSSAPPHEDHDVVVVGAGIAGVYAVQRFTGLGLSVLCIDSGADVGGVWYHNSYPGARVDVPSIDFCYYFSEELYREWRWSEKYATQPEIQRYLGHVADKFELRRHIRFNTWVEAARWDDQAQRYTVRTDDGLEVRCRFLVMATGNLSIPRKPTFPGLDDFKGRWVRTSFWPKEGVDLAGKRIAVIGTGSTGVQFIPEAAKVARHVHVLQRTANYSIPAHNGPIDEQEWQRTRADVRKGWQEQLGSGAGARFPVNRRPMSEFSEQERREQLERFWQFGGHSFNVVFGDQGVSKETNDVVREFVCEQIRRTVKDPAVARKLLPTTYPIGTRRIGVDTGYYETYNRPNVTLVDIQADPIERVTETGIRTGSAHHEVDLIVLALGFETITGAVANVDIRNAEGMHPMEHWQRGPRSYLGLMTAGFPNLFMVTGPGSPAVLANMFTGTAHHVDMIGDCIAHMDRHGYRSVVPTAEAEEAWTQYVSDVARPMLRFWHDNYMVHVNRDDGSRSFIPFAGGLNVYVERCNEVIQDGYRGFSFQ